MADQVLTYPFACASELDDGFSCFVGEDIALDNVKKSLELGLEIADVECDPLVKVDQGLDVFLEVCEVGGSLLEDVDCILQRVWLLSSRLV